MTFVYPTFISVCGFTVLDVNKRTQSLRHDGRLNHLSTLTTEERDLAEDEEKRKRMNEVDLCHCGCYCVRYSQLDEQYHSNLACCQPTGYLRDGNICSRYFMVGEERPVAVAAEPGDCAVKEEKAGANEPILTQNNSRSDADDTL